MNDTKLIITEEVHDCDIDLLFNLECSSCHEEWQCDTDDFRCCPYCGEPFVGRDWVEE